MGAAAIKQELGVSPISLRRIFCAEGIPAINSHRLFNGIHTHLGRMIFGHHAFIGAGNLVLNHPGTFVSVIPGGLIPGPDILQTFRGSTDTY